MEKITKNIGHDFLSHYFRKVKKHYFFTNKELEKYAGKIKRTAIKKIKEIAPEGYFDHWEVTEYYRICLRKTKSGKYRFCVGNHYGTGVYIQRKIELDHDGLHLIDNLDVEDLLNDSFDQEYLEKTFLVATRHISLIEKEMEFVEKMAKDKVNKNICSFIKNFPDKRKFVAKKFLVNCENSE